VNKELEEIIESIFIKIEVSFSIAN